MQSMDNFQERGNELSRSSGLGRSALLAYRRMKAAAKLGLLVAVLIAVLGIALTISRKQISKLEEQVQAQETRIQELIDTPVVVNPVAPEINLDTLYKDIQGISELATVEYLFTDAAKFSDSKQFRDWNIPFTEKSFLLKWSGQIKAGVALDQVVIEVKEGEGKILVSLPSPEILSYEIDSDSVEVIDEQDNLFNSITVQDKVKFDTKTEEAMKERAIENGILNKAQANAQDALTQLITYFPGVGDDYVIEFSTLN